MHSLKVTFTYGFALFAMFFGSGNLVFPIKIGHMTDSSWLLGFLGLFFTGIILPFLGLFVVKLYKGNLDSFFGEAGKLSRTILPFFTLSLLGSFGVVPRCITVAYGGISYTYPFLSLEIFSFLFCLITFFFCLNEQRMFSILGKWLSPLLLCSLTVLICVGITASPPKEMLSQCPSSRALIEGFTTGYQTMDLFAAFFFSSLIFKQLQSKLPSNIDLSQMIKFAVKPSILGATILAIVYLGFVFLGAKYSCLIDQVEPANMLATIATHIMGKNASIFITLAMLLSCLTTAVALNSIYARYIHNTLKLNSEKFSFTLAITTIVSFLISLFDFRGIASFLAPALEISYPSVIALTILCILTRKHFNIKVIVFYSLLALMLLNYVNKLISN